MPRPSGGGDPTVTKGSLTFVVGNFAKSFMFNPPEIDDDKAVQYGTVEVPGVSHPVYQFGSGGERLIGFTLYVDGDRGRLASPNANTSNSSTNNLGLDISNEILFYRSLVYPVQYNSVFANVFPPMVIFNFGSLYRNVRCIVKKCRAKPNFFTPDLKPVRATVEMQLAEVVDGSVLSQDLLSQGGWNTPGVPGGGAGWL